MLGPTQLYPKALTDASDAQSSDLQRGEGLGIGHDTKIRIFPHKDYHSRWDVTVSSTNSHRDGQRTLLVDRRLPHIHTEFFETVVAISFFRRLRLREKPNKIDMANTYLNK